MLFASEAFILGLDTHLQKAKSDAGPKTYTFATPPPPSYLISSFDTSSFLFSLFFFTIHNIRYFCNKKCFCKKARQGVLNQFKEHVNTSGPWEKFIITQIL